MAKKWVCDGYVVETYTTQEMYDKMVEMFKYAYDAGKITKEDHDKYVAHVFVGWTKNTVRGKLVDAVKVAGAEVARGYKVRVSPAQIDVTEQGMWQGGYTITGEGTVYGG